MTGEEQAVSALTLLVAVTEQAVLAMDALDPPGDGKLVETAERLRDLAMVELQFGRLRNPGTGTQP